MRGATSFDLMGLGPLEHLCQRPRSSLDAAGLSTVGGVGFASQDPSYDVFNPARYLADQAQHIGRGHSATGAAMGNQRYLSEVLGPVVALAVVLYLLQKRLIRLKASGSLK